MPSYQGELDGLCGPYAIANAFEIIGYDDRQSIFRTACSALAQRRWPQTLWDGTTIGDMKLMISACRKQLQDTDHLVVRYPFLKVPPQTNKAYWERFDEIFDDEFAACGIIGLTHPSYHWIVVGRDGGRLAFCDTSPHRPYVRKNRSSLFAGERRQQPSQWLIDRRELIVFSSKT